MKKNILFALLSLMPLLTSAKISPEEIKLGSENPEGVVSYVGALTNKQSLAFTYAKQWVSKTFNNYKAVVQLEDNDNYKIVLKGTSLIFQKNTKETFANTETSGRLYYTVTIDVKEGKFRIKFEDMSVKRNIHFSSSLIQTSDINDSFTFSEIETKLADPTTPKGLKEHIVEFPLSAKNSIAGLINSLEDALNLNDDF